MTLCPSPSFRVYGCNFHILLILAMSLVYTRCLINGAQSTRNGRFGKVIRLHLNICNLTFQQAQKVKEIESTSKSEQKQAKISSQMI